jgi:hypothetical protein
VSPLAALTAIIFGSAAAISFGLTATLVIFLALRGEQPQLAHEIPPLISSCLWFIALAGVSGVALYAALKMLPWRIWMQGAMWLAVISVGAAYWPQ